MAGVPGVGRIYVVGEVRAVAGCLECTGSIV
jgi:hypothetical protein